MSTHSTGIPARAISALMDRFTAEGLCMHGFTLSQRGQTAAQGYWAPFTEAAPHRMFSVSKSVTSLAIGLLVEDGKLKLSDPICDYFPDYLPKTVPGPLRRLTIRDMLRMATCHRQTTYKKKDDPNWTRTFFTVPPTHEPGMVFSYDTSSSHTLAALAERLTGKPLLDFVQKNLFDGIGATDEKRWLADPVGVSQGGSGLVMSLRDLAKTAQFCLSGGKGTPLEGYLAQATAKQIETPLQGHAEERYGYGYQFWRIRNNGFAMYGLGGQLAVCLPEQQTAFCTIADTQLDPNGVQKIYDAFFREIYPYLSGGTASERSEWDALGEKLKTLAVRPVENTPAFAGAYGREYAFHKNPTGFSCLCLQDGELVYENAAGRHALPFGIGEWASSVFPNTEEPCVASAGWIAPGVLRLTCHLTGDHPCGVDMLLCFRDDTVTLQMQSVRDLRTENYAGTATGRAVKRL